MLIDEPMHILIFKLWDILFNQFLNVLLYICMLLFMAEYY